jgi:hypothetical protein
MGGKKNHHDRQREPLMEKWPRRFDGAGGDILSASPGYPLLGCTSAEPNSVSPGELMTPKLNRCVRIKAKVEEKL